MAANLELLIQQNTIAIQQLIANSKNLDELPKFTFELQDEDLILFWIANTEESVAVSYQDLLAQLTLNSDKNYLHNQGTPSDTWVIQHNLNKYPTAVVFDSAKTQVEGEVTYLDLNNLTIKFNGAFSGQATLN